MPRDPERCSCGAWCDYRVEDYGPHRGGVYVQDPDDICPRHVCEGHRKIAHTKALWPAIDPDPQRTVNPLSADEAARIYARYHREVAAR